MKSPISLKMQWTWVDTLGALEKAPGCGVPRLCAMLGTGYHTMRTRLRTLEQHRLVEDRREDGERSPRFHMTAEGERTLATLRAVGQ